MIKNVVVTGAAGFVGGNLTKTLLERGYRVTGIDNLQFGYKQNLPEHENFCFVQTDFNYLDEQFYSKFDVLVHCACANIIYAIKEHIKTFEVNALHTQKLFQKFHGKIIYTSTASIYGNAKKIPTAEDAPYDCYNAYDTSKYIGELFLAQRGNYTTLRLSNVYGINQHPEHPYSGVIGKMIGLSLKNEPIQIVGNGEQTRDFTYIDDTVNALAMAIEQDAKNCEINIASGIETKIIDLAGIILFHTGGTRQPIHIEKRGIDGIERRCLNIERAEKLLKWKPQVQLTDGICGTVEWMRNQQKK